MCTCKVIDSTVKELEKDAAKNAYQIHMFSQGGQFSLPITHGLVLWIEPSIL